MVANWPKRHPGLVLAAVALAVLGSLFPRGYMPVTESGRITITLCSAYGKRTATLDLDKERAPPRHTGSTHCWGVFPAFAVTPDALPLPVPALGWTSPAPELPPTIALRHVFHFDPNAPPQAPPLL